MDLLERAEFFDQLHDTLADAMHGHGRVALVTGEAGIGKTSLVEQFAESQKDQCRVLWGGCDALFTPRPLGPLYDIAQQLRGNLITLLEDEAPRAAIFSAAFDALQNHTATLLVIEECSLGRRSNAGLAEVFRSPYQQTQLVAHYYLSR